MADNSGRVGGKGLTCAREGLRCSAATKKMLIEIAFGKDLSLIIMGHSKINHRRIALRFRCAQIT